MDSSTFLRDYYHFHQKFTTNVKFPENIDIWIKSRQEKTTDYASVFAYTVLNRVIFLQFLGINNQILPEDFLQHSLQKCKKGGSIYRDWLAPIWFEILTVPTKKRNLDRIPSEFKDLPFLNTSLFIPLNHIEIEDTTWLYPVLEINNEDTIWQEILAFLTQYTWRFDEAQNGKSNCMTPAILGEIFEKLCTFQKGTGSYYTPNIITDFMTERWFACYISQFLKVPHDNMNQNPKSMESITQILIYKKQEVAFLDRLLHSLKICDNSCGSGAYLISFFSFIYRLELELSKLPSISSSILEILSEEEKTRLNLLSSISKEPLSYFLMVHTLQSTLHGVDIQSESVQITRYRLWLGLLPFVTLTFCKKCEDQGFSPLPDLQNTIKCGNSLLGFYEIAQLKAMNPEILTRYPKVKNILSQSNRDWCITNLDDLRKDLNAVFQELCEINLGITKGQELSLQLFHWMLEFPAVFFRENPGFDLILGNPPYIRQEHINNLLDPLNYKSILHGLYPSSHSLFDFSNYFILRSLQLTRPSGFHTYIITNK